MDVAVKKFRGAGVLKTALLLLAALLGLLAFGAGTARAEEGAVVYGLYDTDHQVYACDDKGTKKNPDEVIGNGTVTNVFVADGVTKIEDSAFQYCGALKEITMSDTVTEIGDHTFSYSGLANIIWPKNLTKIKIGFDAFSICHDLKEVALPDADIEIDGNAFYDSGLTSITFPENPENSIILNSDAFRFAGNLTTITLPETVTEIGESVFFDTGLTSVTLPENLKSIGPSAFQHCANLTRIVLSGATPPTVEDDAFANTPSSRYMVLTGAAATSDEYNGGWAGFTKTKALGTGEVSLPSITDQTYTGSAFEPDIGIPGTKDTDYQVTYENNTNAGTATAHITADGCLGMYTGAADVNFTITPAPLTIEGLSAQSRSYNGTAAVTLTGGNLKGIFGGDDVSIAMPAEGTVADANKGTEKPVTYTLPALQGSQKDNYSLTAPELKANITAAPLTIEGLSAKSRPYDGSTAVTLTGGSLKGVIGSEDVSIAMPAEGTVADANKGTEKPVTYTLPALQGSQKDNYSLTAPELKANITAAPLTIEGLSAQSRPYDGSTAVTLTGGSLKGVIGSEDVSIVMPMEGTVSDASKGTGKAVTYTPPELQGSDKGNYSLTVPEVKADITPAPLTIEGLSAQSRPYDGSTAVTLTGKGSLEGVIGSEKVSVEMPNQGTFEDANVGTAKAVSYAAPLTGEDKDNYRLTASTLEADITPAPLTLADGAIAAKTYDGTTGTAVESVSFAGLQNNEALIKDTDYTAAAAFTDAAAGDDKAAAITVKLMANAKTANYTLEGPETIAVKGNIAKATPAYELPKDLTAVYGQTLKDVVLPAGFSWQDDESTAVGNAGSNTFKATYTPEDTANYQIVADIEVTIEVSKATPAYDVPENRTAIYGQTLKDVVLPAGFSWQDPEDTAVGNAGSNTFKVTYTPADPANYQTIADIEVTIEVSKATPAYELPKDRTAVYGQTLKDVALPAGFSWQANESTAVGNAGSNTFKAIYTPEDTANYQTVADIEVTIEVSKATPAYELPKDRTAVYGQTLKDVALPAGFSWQANESTAVGNAGSNTFKATYTPADPANYQTVADIEVTITVSKGESTLVVQADKTQFTYGEAFTLTVNVDLKPQSRSLTRAAADTVDFYLGDPADNRQLATAAVENSKATATIEQSNPHYPNGGSADITVVYNGSGSLNKSIGSLHLDITPAAGSAQVSQAGWTYGQAGDRPVPVSETNGTENVTYAYKTKDAGDDTYQAEKPTNAGQYTLRATFAATQNYKAVTATADFTIEKAQPVLTIAPEAGKEIQVGEPVTLNIDVKGEKEEQPKGTIAILGQTLPLQAGQATVVYTPADDTPKTLTATYTPAEGENYTGTQASLILTAGKKTRAPIILEDSTKTYGDPAFTLTPTGGSLQAGEAYTCQSDDEAVAVVKADGTVTIKGAGTAHITVSVAESSAWNPAAATMTLTVDKAKITGVSFEDAAFTEDSAEHKIELTGSLPEGTSVSYENNVQKAPGTYTAKAIIDGGVNYESLELTAVLTINEKPADPTPVPPTPTPGTGSDTTSNPAPENTTNNTTENTTERTTDNTNTGLAGSGTTAVAAVLLSLLALTGLVLWQKSKKQ